MLCSAVSSALGSLCNKEAAKKNGTGYSLWVAAYSGCGFVDWCGFFIWRENFDFGSTCHRLAAALYLAFLSAAAFSLWTVLLKYNPMGRVTVFNFLIPVFGSLLSVIFLKDSLWNVNTLFALLLVCAGIYLVNREPKIFLNKNIAATCIQCNFN